MAGSVSGLNDIFCVVIGYLNGQDEKNCALWLTT